MKFKELPKEKVDVIGSIIQGSPNSVSGSPWLSVYPCKPEDIVDNPVLLNKTVATAVTLSGVAVLGPAKALYSYDVVRVDGNIFDIDRHLLTLSGSTVLRRKKIEKNFAEHHSTEIPDYYS
jgi:hypothetical protein